MENRNAHNLTNPDVWIRIIYMLLFWLLAALTRFIVGVVALVQALLILLAGSDNQGLRRFGASLSQWMLGVYRFLTFNTEEKPFPFKDWPQVDDASAEGQVLEGELIEAEPSPESSADDENRP